MDQDLQRSRRDVNSLRRAAAIVQVIAASGDAGVRLIDITQATGLRRATVHRLCRTLQSLGWVRQPRDRQRYFLGGGLPLLVSLLPSRRLLAEAGSATLDRIAEETEDTAFLFLHDGLDALCVDRREGSYPVKPLLVDIGDRRPLGLGAAGLAILAALPDEDRGPVLDLLFDSREECRNRGRATIETDLATTRRAGFSDAITGLVSGVAGIGVPILGRAGLPIGAISVAGVESRWPPRRRESFADVLHREAYKIAKNLFDDGAG
ncbi:MAG: helix-turn-helix domain-containing protein [Bauldia litoralis]